MTKEEQLRTWLTENKDVLKSGGFAGRVNYDKASMSQFMSGTRPLPKDVLRVLIFECEKYGFKLEEE